MMQHKYSNLQTQPENYSVSETHRGYNYWTYRPRPVAEPPVPIPLPTGRLAAAPVDVQIWKRQNITDPLRWYMALDSLALMLGFFAAWWVASLMNGHFFNRPLVPNSQG